jgi:uncharacterized protein (TIGR03437 family)
VSGGVAGQQDAAPSDQLLIQEAQASSNYTLRLTGRNFGASTLTVNLDGIHLSVLSSSKTQIVAQLPARLPPGSYLITVSTESASTEFDSIYMKVFPAVQLNCKRRARPRGRQN